MCLSIIGSKSVCGISESHSLSRLNELSPPSNERVDGLKDWLILRERLELSNTLGQGQFGKVFLGYLKMETGNNIKVAVKTIKGKYSI